MAEKKDDAVHKVTKAIIQGRADSTVSIVGAAVSAVPLAGVAATKCVASLIDTTGVRELRALAVAESKDFDEYLEKSKKPKTTIIRLMMSKANPKVSNDVLKEYIGCKTDQTMRNKLSTDTFSMDEFFAAAYACGFDVVLRKKTNSDEEYQIDPVSYFKSYQEKTVSLFLEKDREKQEDIIKELELAQAKVAELEATKIRITELQKSLELQKKEQDLGEK